MKKKIFVALMALLSCFVMASCGDEKENDPKPEGSGIGNTIGTTTTWEETANSIDITICENTQYYSFKTVTSYAFSGDKITGMTMVEDCGSVVLAKEVYAELYEDMEEDDDVVYSLEGSKIKAVFGPSHYENLTKEEVILLAEMMKNSSSSIGGLLD